MTAPRDATARYCTAGADCGTGVLLMDVTITAGDRQVDPAEVAEAVTVRDANYSSVGRTKLGDMPVPAGQTHVEHDVQLHPDISRVHGLIVVTLEWGDQALVEWVQDSR
jgi:hypothetical protein